MSKNNKHSRRDLLKALGVGAAVASSPMEIFLDSLVDGIVAKAVASENKNKFKYIMIQNYAAPPRWMFDLFLAPYGGKVTPNASVGSELVLTGTGSNRRYTQATYKTHNVKGIRAPRIWTHNVGSPSGSARPLSDLMNNMLVLQGIDALNPGHAIAAAMLNRPLTSLSLDGVLADKSGLPFGSLGFNTLFNDFKSKEGFAHKRFADNQDAAKILPEAFETGDVDIHKKYKAEIDSATEKLNRSLARVNLQGSKLSKTLKSTKEVMSSEILKIRKDLPALVAKYERIISKTVDLSKNLKGFSDFPVSDPSASYAIGGSNRTYDRDLRTALNNVRVGALAKRFALTEYVITNSFTSCSGLNVNAFSYPLMRADGQAARQTGISSDQHRMDALTSVFFTTIYYRVTGACILGLVDALKAKRYEGSNMFDYTVIRHTGEFGRHPRDVADNMGSDHSPWSNSNMLLSGMIKGATVAGEILSDGATIKRRKGSWGAGGYLKHGAKATTGHVVSTLAAMLEIESPSSNNPSLIVKNSKGEVELNEHYIGKTKVV